MRAYLQLACDQVNLSNTYLTASILASAYTQVQEEGTSGVKDRISPQQHMLSSFDVGMSIHAGGEGGAGGGPSCLIGGEP